LKTIIAPALLYFSLHFNKNFFLEHQKKLKEKEGEDGRKVELSEGSMRT
jgi:hypothetical protein